MRFVILVIPFLIGRGERVQLAGPDKARFRILMDRLREQMQCAQTLRYDGFCMASICRLKASSRQPIRYSGTISLRSTGEMAQVGLNLMGINPVASHSVQMLAVI